MNRRPPREGATTVTLRELGLRRLAECHAFETRYVTSSELVLLDSLKVTLLAPQSPLIRDFKRVALSGSRIVTLLQPVTRRQASSPGRKARRSPPRDSVMPR